MVGLGTREPWDAGVRPAGAACAITDLAGRALAGDRGAMRQLFAHVICPAIERRLAHRLARAGADRAALGDHVQEVVVHLLEHDAGLLRRWDPARGALAAYVAKVADNLVISWLRRRPPPCPSEDLDRRAAATQTPEQGAAFAGMVGRLVGALPARDAALFRAVYLEELSADEAAARLGISRDAAHKRIQRLRARLARSADLTGHDRDRHYLTTQLIVPIKN